MGQLVQIGGALAILAAFVLAQVGMLNHRSLWYLALNVLGAAILTVNAYFERQWGFVLLEGRVDDRLGVGPRPDAEVRRASSESLSFTLLNRVP